MIRQKTHHSMVLVNNSSWGFTQTMVTKESADHALLDSPTHTLQSRSWKQVYQSINSTNIARVHDFHVSIIVIFVRQLRNLVIESSVSQTKPYSSAYISFKCAHVCNCLPTFQDMACLLFFLLLLLLLLLLFYENHLLHIFLKVSYARTYFLLLFTSHCIRTIGNISFNMLPETQSPIKGTEHVLYTIIMPTGIQVRVFLMMYGFQGIEAPHTHTST